MGSYCSYKISCEFISEQFESEIIYAANNLDTFKNDNSKIQEWCWRKFCPESKWHGADDIAIFLSKKFTSTIFKVECRGEWSYIHYYMNGKCLSHDFLYGDQYPTRTLFNKKLKQKIVLDEQNRVKQEAAKKQKDMQAAKDELEKIKKLQAELEEKLKAA